MRRLFNELLFFFLLTAFLLGAKNEGLAAEFDFIYHSPLLDQFAIHAVDELSKAIRSEEAEMIECAKRIDGGATQALTLKRVRLLKDILIALEGGDLSHVKLQCALSPTVIGTSNELEITMLVYFSVTGKRVHSGLMTMMVIHPSVAKGSQRVVGGLQLGHIAVSEAPVVE